MTLHRGLHMWSLKPYCVTFMDCWTPLKLFWTLKSAIKCRDRFGHGAYAYRWDKSTSKWVKIKG